MKNIISTVIIVFIAIIAGYFSYQFVTESSSKQEMVEIPDTITETLSPTPPPSAEIADLYEISEPEVEEPVTAPLPPIVPPPAKLDDSDSQVLLAVTEVSADFAQWLIPEQQIRKWVLAIDLMADGKLPRRYRPLNFPMSKFSVKASAEQTNNVINGDKFIAVNDNHKRMNAIINSLSKIDPALLARYYKQWLPILEQAYSEQGKPGSFNQRFLQTISQVLAVNQLSNNPTLVRPKVLYRYADKSLEQASDIEKLLWRMGPDNSLQLQFFLRELRTHIDQ